MNFKPKTLMIASLAVALTVMSTSTLAQTIRKKNKPNPPQKSKQKELLKQQRRQAPRLARIGELAPSFNLKDASGKSYSLSDYKGKIVVLQWISQDCPVCIRVSSTGLVDDMLKTIKGIDGNVVHLTIHSNAGAKISKSAEYLKKYNIKSPALDDTNGRIGRIYGAKTTPHMYVIDKEGILRYSGAIDDDQAGRKGSDATNYVVNAIQQIATNETVTPDKTKSYGCSIKYASASQRPSRGERGERGQRGGRAGQMFSRLDTNGDGQIDAKEMESLPENRRQAILDRFDTNKNGALDKEEIEAASQQRRRGGGEGRERGGRRGGRGGDGG